MSDRDIQLKSLGSIAPMTADRKKTLHRGGFFTHLRPNRYPVASISFRHTLFLGFMTTLLLVVEAVTGMLLMVYYSPAPETAYLSILRLESAVPFGQLLRNLHRLAGDLLVLCTLLHLLRVLVSGSYTGRRRRVWFSGMFLLLLVLALAFSGYLLPWDQLSYWAVTVGTGLFGSLPVIGEALQLLLRGGAEFGADGLLRFYVLHVLILPAIALVFCILHYYRTVRLHGIALPLGAGQREAREPRTVPLWPVVAVREAQLILVALICLLVAAAYLYHAPLGPHADPLHTPSHIQAPWFFLWIQGILGLGATSLTGLGIPFVLMLLYLFLPYIDRGERRPLGRQPATMALLIATLGLFAFGSYLGAREQQPQGSSAESIVDSFAPREHPGPLNSLSYDSLTVGLYPLGKTPPAGVNPALADLLAAIDASVRLGADQRLFAEPCGVLIVEPLQDRLKRITLRMTCSLPDTTERRTVERIVYRSDFTTLSRSVAKEVN